MKLGILIGYKIYKHPENYILACKKLNIEYKLINILNNDWISKIKQSKCDGFLVWMPSDIQEEKTIYDEKIYFIAKILNKHIYPSYEELYIYENKRMMAYFLEVFNFPMPKTDIFYNRKDALHYINTTPLPLVFKANIGWGSMNVDIVRNKFFAKYIILRIFGLIHPLLTFGYVTWTRRYKNIPLPLLGKIQKHYLLVQEYSEIKWEWRIIKIGNSYFGHQKLLNGEFASGSDLVGWVKPPIELLKMVKNIAQKGGFYSIAVDIFETEENKYLINEIQSLFGSFKSSQMYIDNKPCRYIEKNNQFILEYGEFNYYGSNVLRVKHFVELLNEINKE